MVESLLPQASEMFDSRGVFAGGASAALVVASPMDVTTPAEKRDWSSYNQAQVTEKEGLQELLKALCADLPNPQQAMGRPRVPIADIAFASVLKVYSGMSGRRFMSDLRDAHAKGYISNPMHYNSISNFLENPDSTLILKDLIEQSSLPMRLIETEFALDSSGFSTGTKFQHGSIKHGSVQMKHKKRNWLKLHAMCGLRTKIITAVEISPRYIADGVYFDSLVDATVKNFDVRQVAGDGAYSSKAIIQSACDSEIVPVIPFRPNATPYGVNEGTAWAKVYHLYGLNREWFIKQRDLRNSIESVFSMLKRKFGERLKSKSVIGQCNEVLCKVLCHNLSVLMHSMYTLKREGL